MSDDDRRVTYFAATHTRGKRDMFGIRGDDRGKHVYVIGKTGMGKSTMLENMAIQDIQNGEGIAFIDPHGATAEKLLDFIPYNRIQDVVYFAPFDTDYPVGFNVMEDVGFDKRHLVVSGLMGAFKRIWVDAWSARMEYILQNTLLALLEYPDSTLLDVNRMLTNKNFRAAVVEKITDPIVKEFWTVEFQTYTDRYTQEATPAIQNKVGQFVSNPLIRNIVGQPKSTFDIRKLMDEKKILIVNLSKGRMGETNASLLGSMLTVKIYLAAMSRAEESPARMAKLPRFYFYVDEFQSMMNEAFADILSESRKYKLALTLANQYIEQMEEKVRDAVFGNVGTLIVFRVGPFDAEVLETIFDPTFTSEDLVELGLGQIYLTLMIDGVGSSPFSAETIPPIERPSITYKNDVVESSRTHFGVLRTDIEKTVIARQLEYAPPPPKKKEGDFRRAPTSSPVSASGRNFSNSQAQFRPQMTTRTTEFVQGGAPQLVAVAPRREEPERNTLRDAIQAARPASPQNGRSPLEILRQKQAAKLAREAMLAPKTPPVPRPAPTPAAKAPPPPPPPPPQPSQPKPSHKEAPEVSSSDAVSPEMLRSVIGNDGPLE